MIKASITPTGDLKSDPTEDLKSTIINSVNGNSVRLREMRDKTTDWHQHTDSDEMFIVLEGNMTIETRDKSYILQEGDSLVVPPNTQHRAVVVGYARILVIDKL